MANTSKGFFYPISSDAPNIPLHMQTLANAVDSYIDDIEAGISGIVTHPPGEQSNDNI